MTIGTDESGIGYSFDDGIFEPVSVVLGGNAYIKQADQMIVLSRDAMRALAQTIIDESARTASSTREGL